MPTGPALIAEKSGCPPNIPITGVITSFVMESTIAVNAAPIITPTARSTTFPRRMNSLNPAISCSFRGPKYTRLRIRCTMDDYGESDGAYHGAMPVLPGGIAHRPQDLGSHTSQGSGASSNHG